MISRNDPCWCGSNKKWKKCHYPALPPTDLKNQYANRWGIILKTEEEIKKIRAACKIASKILDTLCNEAKPGVTTNELDKLSRTLHEEAKATPACLGYGEPPFPKTICTSLNEVICHGIPNDIPLQEGDIINIDVTSIVDGFYGDCSRMVIVGSKTDPERKKVVDCSFEALMKSIEICKPGLMLCEIGNVIEEVAKKYKCSVVDQFVGHGVGIDFHEPPQVCHHYNHMQIPLAEGMTFTIEPMINAGKKAGRIEADGWTAKTVDGKPSAQWEHTLLITKDGHEILTQNSSS